MVEISTDMGTYRTLGHTLTKEVTFLESELEDPEAVVSEIKKELSELKKAQEPELKKRSEEKEKGP